VAVSLAAVAAASALEVTVKWSVNLEDKRLRSCHHSSPTVYDLDGDGKGEIIFACRKDVDRVVCFNDDRTVKWYYPPLGEDPLGGDVLSKMTTVGISKEGKVETLFGSRHRHVYCLTDTGQLLWKYGPAPQEETP